MLPEGIKDIRLQASDDDLRKFFNVKPNLRIITCDNWSFGKDVRINEKIILRHTSACQAGVLIKISKEGMYWDNENGPAMIEFNRNGKPSVLSYEVFHKNGMHRPFYPARYRFSNSFKEFIIKREEHFLRGKHHNSIGPAIRSRTSNNEKWHNHYYLHGICCERDVFFNSLKERQKCFQ